MSKQTERTATRPVLTEGLDNIFKGLGDLLKAAAQIADLTDEAAEVSRNGSVQRGDLRAVYGVSVRVGASGRPRVEQFGNLRQKPGEKPVIDEFREPLIDVLDEGDHFLVVAELPGMDESAVQWKIEGEKVVISAQSGDRKYYKKLSLASPIAEENTASSYKNGILWLRLWKR